MRIYSRAEWGAEHPDGDGPAPLPADEVYLHHSATTAPPASASVDLDAAVVRLLEQIGQVRFRAGISYTFLIPPSGRVFEGHSVGRRGTHTRGRNMISRAICLVGNYERDGPTAAQLLPVAELLAHGHKLGWWSLPRLTGGHRDAPGAATLCPGGRAWSLIGGINAAAAEIVAPRPVRESLREGDTGSAVLALQWWLNRVFPSYSRIDLKPQRYGPQTVAVIAEFQRRAGVTGPDVDGRLIGPRTWAALEAHGYR